MRRTRAMHSKKEQTRLTNVGSKTAAFGLWTQNVTMKLHNDPKREKEIQRVRRGNMPLIQRKNFSLSISSK